MLKIQRMAEAVKADGVKIVTFDNSGKATSRNSFAATQLFWQVFEKNNPFVFAATYGPAKEINENEDINKDYVDFERPFDVFSYELPNAFVTVDHESGNKGVNIDCVMIFSRGVRTWQSDILTALDEYEKYDSSKSIVSAAFDPQSPHRQFAFIYYVVNGKGFVLFDGMWEPHLNEHGNPQILIFDEFDFGKPAAFMPQNFISHLTKKFTERLNQVNTVGQELVNINIYYKGKHNEKRTAKIRKVVHIVPKKIRDDYVSLNKKKIEWTHRFWRRGTWVNFYNPDGSIDYSKIGKDRDGNYNIPGKTWRIESLVNADREDLPIVNKTRIVTE